MKLEDITNNGRAIVVKAISDSISVAVTSFVLAGFVSLGLSAYRLNKGVPIDGSQNEGEADEA